VQVSVDGTKWTTVAQGQGTGTETIIGFNPVQARFVKITQTASAAGTPWTVQRLKLYER
jgi:hypothetical protein